MLRSAFKWLNQDTESPPWMLKQRSSKGLSVAVVAFAVFTDLFTYSVIVPVVPFALESRAHVASKDVQHWVPILVAIYGAALLLASPFVGYYADRAASRRLPLLLGLFALAGATVLLCLARSVGLMILARILQGASAAVVFVVGLALLVDTLGPGRIGEAFGWVGLAMTFSMLIAPILGGIVYQRAGYYAVFAMVFGLVAVDILLRLLLVEPRVAQRWLKTGVTQAPHLHQHARSHTAEGKADPGEVSASIIVNTSARVNGGMSSEKEAVSDTVEGRSNKLKRQLPPIITLLKSRRLLAGLWASFAQATLLASFDGVLPIFVSETFHWDSLGAGLAFLAIALPSIIGPITGRLADRYGPRYLATSGFILATPSLVLLRLVTQNTANHKVLLCALLALLGISFDLILGPVAAEVTYIIVCKERARPGLFGPKGALAQAYALFNLAFAAGCLAGPIWAGQVKGRYGWGAAGWTLALLSGLSAVPTFLLVGGWIGQRGENKGWQERKLAQAEQEVQEVQETRGGA